MMKSCIILCYLSVLMVGTRHLPKTNKLCTISENPFEESFRFILPGYNLRPLDMSGALGIEQLKKLPNIVTGRRENAKKFQALFSNIPGLSIQKEVGESSWFGFALIVESGKAKRDELVSVLTKQGVDCRPIVAGNFVRNPVVNYFNYEVYGDLEAADRVSDCGLFIGNHHFDISSELASIAKIVKRILAE